jgi:hypothetical protein
LWDDAAEPIDVNAVELPDISVGRSKFGHPEWLRIDNGKLREGWGVIGFQVRAIPPQRWLDGYPRFSFRSFHEPEDLNYPHSEVRAYDGEKHIGTLDDLPEETHLEWRELLLQETEIFLKPNEPAGIRRDPPASHKPELPIPRE